MGIFTYSYRDELGFLVGGKMYSAVIDVDTLFGFLSRVHVVVMGPVDGDDFFSDSFEYNTLKRGYDITYEASANARDYVRKALSND